MNVKINPVDTYNNKYLKEALDIFVESNPNIQRIDENSMTYMESKADTYLKKFIVERGKLVAVMDNKLIQKGTSLTPFDILMNVKFKGNFNQALNQVNRQCMGFDLSMIRVGTKYSKVVITSDRYGISRTELLPWDKQTLCEDYHKDTISMIPRYDSFNVVPNNKDYKSVVGNSYNMYAKFAHEASKEPGEFKWIKTLIKHIFNEQFELGLTYLKVMYDNPEQALPILVLTSTERSTGKSTFVDFLNILFGDNAVVINPEDISGTFNGSYANKNVICIEESRFDSVAATEKLKNLSTQKKITYNEKFMAAQSLPFFGKIIITSNDERKFSRVDKEEIRYWVRKIPSLKGKSNHNIHKDLVEEIPNFLNYLGSLPDVDLSRSRMVFKPEEIRTDALNTVKRESRSWLHKEVIEQFESLFLDNRNIKEIEFVAKDIKDLWFKHNSKVDISYLNKVFREEMKLIKGKTKRYLDPTQLHNNLSSVTKRVGRPYKITNIYFGIKLEDEQNEIDLNG